MADPLVTYMRLELKGTAYDDPPMFHAAEGHDLFLSCQTWKGMKCPKWVVVTVTPRSGE